jgi:DNA-binding NtrC family response regulator/tetratricopeptide (TPR) repeat protein
VHDSGLVHCDVKPANILIEKKRPVLVDFGLASRVETLAGQARGTLAFMAPEILLGSGFDRRADLYSLGATLYFAASGRPPYPGETPLDLIRQHRSTSPDPLDIPRPLRELIEGLLQVRPWARWPSARAALESLGIPAPGAPILPRSGRFVGRSGELERLTALLDPSRRESRAGLLWVCGEPGIGKSRLLEEAAVEAQLAGARVLRSRPGTAIWNELLDPLDPEAAAHLRSEAASPAFAAEQLLARAADARPLALFIDDLDHARESDQSIFFQLTARLGRAEPRIDRRLPLALVASARRPPPGAEAVVLGPVDQEASQLLARSILRSAELPAPLAVALREHGMGVPLLIEAILQSLARSGALRWSAGAWSVEERALKSYRPPPDVRRLFAQPLDDMSPSARDALAAAQILQRGATSRALARWMGDASSAAVAELQAAGLVRRAPDGSIRIEARACGRMLEESWTDEERRKMHSRAAGALENPAEIALHRWHAGETDRALELAEAAARASDPAGAALWRWRLVEHRASLRPEQWRGAAIELVPLLWTLKPESWLERARSTLAALREIHDPETQGHADRLEGRFHVAQGEYVAAQPLLRRAVERFENLGKLEETLEAGRHLLLVLANLDRQAEFEENCARFIESSRDHPHLQAEFLRMKALRLLIEGKPADARRLLEQAAALPGLSPGTRGWILNRLGGALLSLGEADRAIETLQSALDLSRRTGNVVLTCQTLPYLGQANEMAGRIDAAFKHYEEGVDLCESFEPTSIVWACTAWGTALFNLERFRSAEQVLERGLAHAGRMGFVDSAVLFRALLARCRIAQGRIAEAVESLRVSDAGLSPTRRLVLVLAKMELEACLGRKTSWAEAAEEARRLQAGFTRPDAPASLATAVCALDLGEVPGVPPPADAVLDRARADLLGAAVRHAEPEAARELRRRAADLRRRFRWLEGIPSLAYLRGLGDLWSGHPADAIEAFRAAAKLSAEENAGEISWRAAWGESLASLALGDFETSRRAARASLETIEKISGLPEPALRAAYLDHPLRRMVRAHEEIRRARTALVHAASWEGQPGLAPRDVQALVGMITHAFRSGMNLKELCEQALFMLVRATDAERGFLVTVDDGGELKVRALRNMMDEKIESPERELSFHIVRRVLQGQAAERIADALHSGGFEGFRSVRVLQLRSVLCVPVPRPRGRGALGAVYLDHRRSADHFTVADEKLARAFAAEISIPLQMALRHEGDGAASDARDPFRFLIGRDPAFLRTLDTARRAAPSTVPILIVGETGTGKELLARAIHMASDRRKGPWAPINVTAIPATLFESELFGYVKGAFTGATRSARGLLESADGGTVFLDEIGDLSPEMQAKLLRVLQSGEIVPLGSSEPRQVDLRILSATHRNLKERVAEGKFREDLYFRLAGLTLELRPLRERAADIPLLASHFLEGMAREEGSRRTRIEPEAMELLLKHPWPGNVRELRNVAASARLLAQGSEIGPRALPPEITGATAPTLIPTAYPELKMAKIRASEEMERRFIENLLRSTQGNISRAAKRGRIHRVRLQFLIKRLGIDPKKFF